MAEGMAPLYLARNLKLYAPMHRELVEHFEGEMSEGGGTSSSYVAHPPKVFAYLGKPQANYGQGTTPVNVTPDASNTIVDTVAPTITTSANVQVTQPQSDVIVSTLDPTVTATVDQQTIGFFIDWDDDDDYNDTYDDISADVIRAQWRIGMREPWQSVADEINATITLDNTTGKYNPENTSSPIYGKIRPHLRMRIAMDDGAGGIDMWNGWVNVPQTPWDPKGAQAGKVTAVMHGGGPKAQLEGIDIDLPLYENTTGDVPVLEALSQIQSAPAVGSNIWRLGGGRGIGAWHKHLSR